jgi:hypothetical protein
MLNLAAKAADKAQIHKGQQINSKPRENKIYADCHQEGTEYLISHAEDYPGVKISNSLT